MLNRKPRVGEILDYDSRVVGGTRTAEYRVTRFDTRAGQESLMYVVDTATGTETPIIWSFRDGLNKCLSHRQFQVGATTTRSSCGDCPHVAEHCRIFHRRVRSYDFDKGVEVYLRLPECVAASNIDPEGEPDAAPQPPAA